MKKFRFLVIVLAFLMGLSVFGGCRRSGGGNSDADPDIEGGDLPFRVALMEGPVERTNMEKLIAGFKAKNPDVKQEFKIVSYAGDYAGKIQSQASAGVLPDVFLNIDILAGFFAKNKISMDLLPYFTTEEDKAILDNVYESMLELGMMKVGDKKELHMIPREYARMACYFNKAILRDAGVADEDFPKNGWKWDEFKALAEKCVKKSGGMTVRNGADLRLNWNPPVLSIINGFSGKLFNEEGTAGELNEGTMVAFEEIRSMIETGAFANNFRGTGTSFSTSSIAMYIDGRGGLKNLQNQIGAENLGVVSMPELPVPSVGGGTSGYSVSNRSHYKETAVKFIKYILSEEGQNILAETGTNVSVLKSLADDGVWRTAHPELNNDAFVWHPEYDVMPINAYIANQEKSGKVIDALNQSLEAYVSLPKEPSANEKNGYMTEFTTKLTQALI